jgi:predicted peptidase
MSRGRHSHCGAPPRATGITVLAVAAALLTACGRGDDSDVAPGGPSSERIALRPRGSVEGAPAGYVEYLPPGYGDRTRRPLLVFLHGAGENGDGSEHALERVLDASIPALIQKDRWPEGRPFVVLAPQHQGGLGAGGEGPLCFDAAEIEAFLAFALRRYAVDRRRVYLTGYSCGAIGAWEYLGEHTNEVVAAAVLIAGDGNRAVGEADCALARVPIWAFHGELDSVVSPFGSIRPIRLLRMCTDPKPVDLRLTVYPGGDHGASGPTYSLSAGHDVYAWLLRHRNR